MGKNTKRKDGASTSSNIIAIDKDTHLNDENLVLFDKNVNKVLHEEKERKNQKMRKRYCLAIKCLTVLLVAVVVTTTALALWRPWLDNKTLAAHRTTAQNATLSLVTLVAKVYQEFTTQPPQRHRSFHRRKLTTTAQPITFPKFCDHGETERIKVGSCASFNALTSYEQLCLSDKDKVRVSLLRKQIVDLCNKAQDLSGKAFKEPEGKEATLSDKAMALLHKINGKVEVKISYQMEVRLLQAREALCGQGILRFGNNHIVIKLLNTLKDSYSELIKLIKQHYVEVYATLSEDRLEADHAIFWKMENEETEKARNQLEILKIEVPACENSLESTR